MKYDLTVISPCFNESANVKELVERLQRIFQTKNLRAEIVLVNDASTDNTGELIKELVRQYPNVVAKYHQYNQGIARSWKTGLAAAQGVYVCLIDADLQNLPEDVWRLYQEICFSKADLVQGWRSHIGRLSRTRIFLSRLLNFLLNFLFSMQLKDNKSGFVLGRKEVLQDILTHKYSYHHPQTFIAVAAKTKGYSIREVETLFQDRLLGRSYFSGVWSTLKVSLQTFSDVFKGFFEFRLARTFDSALRDFLKKNPPQKQDAPLSLCRSLYFKLYTALFPLHHWFISYNAPGYYQDLKKSQWLPKEKIKEYQEQKLRQLIVHAYHHIPFYRELFEKNNLRPEDIQAIEDLPKLPTIDKKTVRENFYFFLSNNHDKRNIQKMRTSGSTGEPFMVFGDKRQLELRWAATQRSLEWTGWWFGNRQVRLWHKYLGMRPLEVVKEIFDAFLTRRRFIPAYEITDANLQRYVHKIMRFKPILLDGYAESFNFLARYLKLTNAFEFYQGFKPKGIMTSAQTLPEESRKIIEEIFGCQVLDKYGAREFGGGIAYQCGQTQGYHVVAECNVVEIIKDGQPAKPGEIGEVVITELNNYALPLIRYKIGDLAVKVPDNYQCPCGRGLPLIGSIVGRMQSIVVGTSHQYIPGTFFNRVFFKHDSAVRQYQIVQERFGELLIKLVKANLFTDDVLKEILKDIKEHMGDDLNIEVEFVNEIPLGRTGKRQHCISYLDPLDVSQNLHKIKKD